MSAAAPLVEAEAEAEAGADAAEEEVATIAPILVPEDGNLLPFLFMGCWNEPSLPARELVAARINANEIKTLILAGDNVYPPEGSKTHNIETFLDGIRLFRDKRIFGALGNHNVRNTPVEEAELAYPDWTLPARYYARQFRDGYALVVLDTNIVEVKAKINAMVAWLRAIVDQCRAAGIRYYIVQHEPYATYKKKKIVTLVGASKLLEAMAPYPPEAILCADTHNFQIGTIHVGGTRILQYTVGTGGAKHDPIEVELNPIPIGTGGIFMTFESHIPGYGFLEVRPGRLDFVRAADWPAPRVGAEGGRRSRRARRRGTRRQRR